MRRCPGRPDAPCDFVVSSNRLTNARRSLRGHTLRAHGMALSADDSALQSLTDSELQASLEVYRRGRRSSTQRRRQMDFDMLSQLEELQALTSNDVGGNGVLGRSVAGAIRTFPDAALGAAPPPDLSSGQVLCPSPTRHAVVGSPPRSVQSVATQAGARPIGLPPILLPAPGLSIQQLVEFVRQRPTLSAGETVIALEQQRGSRYTAAQRLQLAGFVTAVIATEVALCNELSAAWASITTRSVLPPPDATQERMLAFNRLLARMREISERFLPREHTSFVDPGDYDFPDEAASD